MNANYWQQKYQAQQTGWDTAAITPPLKAYFDQIEDKNIKILIPGCGNAYEAAYLWQQGFKNVHLCDWAALPLQNFAKQNPSFPKEQLICSNFFDLEQPFDLIIEQTFFCALPRTMRENYAEKMAQLLPSNGKLIGLLFSIEFDREGPPFGGNTKEYEGYFQKYFSTVNIQKCTNSIPPRLGTEVFIEIIK